MTRDCSAARNPTGNLVPMHDRHLAEDVAGPAPADDLVYPVDRLDRLDAALEEGEEGTLVALLRRVSQQGGVAGPRQVLLIASRP